MGEGLPVDISWRDLSRLRDAAAFRSGTRPAEDRNNRKKNVHGNHGQPVGNAPVSMNAGASKEAEYQIRREQNEDPLTKESSGEEKCLRIRQNLHEEVPERKGKWSAEHNGNQPGRSVK